MKKETGPGQSGPPGRRPLCWWRLTTAWSSPRWSTSMRRCPPGLCRLSDCTGLRPAQQGIRQRQRPPAGGNPRSPAGPGGHHRNLADKETDQCQVARSFAAEAAKVAPVFYVPAITNRAWTMGISQPARSGWGNGVGQRGHHSGTAGENMLPCWVPDPLSGLRP